jgi:hypothetical protein
LASPLQLPSASFSQSITPTARGKQDPVSALFGMLSAARWQDSIERSIM